MRSFHNSILEDKNVLKRRPLSRVQAGNQVILLVLWDDVVLIKYLNNQGNVNLLDSWLSSSGSC